MSHKSPRRPPDLPERSKSLGNPLTRARLPPPMPRSWDATRDRSGSCPTWTLFWPVRPLTGLGFQRDTLQTQRKSCSRWYISFKESTAYSTTARSCLRELVVPAFMSVTMKCSKSYAACTRWYGRVSRGDYLEIKSGRDYEYEKKYCKNDLSYAGGERAAVDFEVQNNPTKITRQLQLFFASFSLIYPQNRITSVSAG